MSAVSGKEHINSLIPADPIRNVLFEVALTTMESRIKQLNSLCQQWTFNRNIGKLPEISKRIVLLTLSTLTNVTVNRALGCDHCLNRLIEHITSTNSQIQALFDYVVAEKGKSHPAPTVPVIEREAIEAITEATKRYFKQISNPFESSIKEGYIHTPGIALQLDDSSDLRHLNLVALHSIVSILAKSMFEKMTKGTEETLHKINPDLSLKFTK